MEEGPPDDLCRCHTADDSSGASKRALEIPLSKATPKTKAYPHFPRNNKAAPVKKLISGIFFCAALIGTITTSSTFAQSSQTMPMERIYRGPIVLPDFKGRDRAFANYRTRISEEMKTGPNFAGHYAIVIIGCGTSCSFAYVADVSTGQVYSFPYGGEEYYQMDIRYSAKSNSVTVSWILDDNCMRDYLTWTGTTFKSYGPRHLDNRQQCE